MLARFTGISAVAIALALGGPAAAQDDDDDAASPPPEESVIVEQDQDQVLTADLIGANVLHPEHGEIGYLDSILFDEDDRIVGGVIAVGGFLGIGAKRVALAWDQFDVRASDGELYVDLTREELETAPGFTDLATIIAEEEAERAQAELDRQQQQQQ